jgi:uncharacterized protein YbbK (DUF523 family)
MVNEGSGFGMPRKVRMGTRKDKKQEAGGEARGLAEGEKSKTAAQETLARVEGARLGVVLLSPSSPSGGALSAAADLAGL